MSRATKDWEWNIGGANSVSGAYSWDQIQTSILMDIRDELQVVRLELETLNRSLLCFDSGRLRSLERHMYRVAAAERRREERIRRWRSLVKSVLQGPGRVMQRLSLWASRLETTKNSLVSRLWVTRGNSRKKPLKRRVSRGKKVRRENVFEYRLYEKDAAKIRNLIDDEIDAAARLILDICSLERLRVVVAVGNEAMYALTKQWGVLSLCGRVFKDMAVPGKPIVVTVHPSFVLRSRDPRWKRAFFTHIKRAAGIASWGNPRKASRTSPRGS